MGFSLQRHELSLPWPHTTSIQFGRKTISVKSGRGGRHRRGEVARNQIIKSIKVPGLLGALCAAAPSNFIRTHGTISPLSPDKCVLLPAGRRRGALPAPAQQDGGLCFGSSASAREHNPPHAGPSPSPILGSGTRGAGRMSCPSPSPPYGDCDPSETQSLELDGSHSLFSHHLFLLPLMLLTPGRAHS